MSNIKYSLSQDGMIAYGEMSDGVIFLIDADMLPLISEINLYRSRRGYPQEYIMNSKGVMLHSLLFPHKQGYEIDHINLNVFDNRRQNVRYCTHQQNQINQPLQKNNTSGVSGVSWYPARNKYRARIKIEQQEIHLGYYITFTEAVQARNIGMKCMFGEYGRYNDVPDPPKWIEKTVLEKCKRFAELSVCKAFLNSYNNLDLEENICSETMKEPECA